MQIAFTRIVTHPEYQALASPRVLHHVGVTTVKRLDQGHLHPLQEPRAACVTGEPSSNELFLQLMLQYLSFYGHYLPTLGVLGRTGEK